MSQPLDPQARIVSAVRTPIGGFLGSLAGRSAVDLGVVAARAAVDRAGLQPDQIDLAYFGNARPAGNGPNPARQIAIRAGLPDTVPATTINMACASGLQAILLGVDAIRLGRARRVLVGGAESMSRVPYLLPRARAGYRMGHAEVVDAMYRDGFDCPLAGQVMGRTAETLAEEYAIDRATQDAFALRSQERAETARREGWFEAEMVPIDAEGREPGLDHDEHPRAGTTLEKLAKLPTVFKADGSVSPGNSSGLTDAASALVLEAPDLRQEGLATILDSGIAGVDPARMGIGPVPATRQLLARTGLTVGDLDQVEINEAFAVQALACMRDLDLDPDRTNVAGGAIALGHPIAATGARITTTLVHTLRRTGGGLGLATLCVSGGMGVSLLVRSD